ncbi:MAG TPA: DinB family protein [Gemmatimonadales bacterium]
MLRGLSPRTAWRRPYKGRHTICELTLHMAYWTHMARDRIAGEKTPFPRSPANFPSQPRRPDAGTWRRDITLLSSEHRALVRLVRGLTPRALGRPAGRWSVADTILGVALHDAYHAGQIGYLRRVIEG